MAGFDYLACFDDGAAELPDGDVVVNGSTIEAVGRGLDRSGVDRVVDCRGLIGIPGLINSHQHLYQGACRAVPQLERAPIGPWLQQLGALVKSWYQAGAFDPTVVEAVAAAVLTESVLSGVTTVADQHYFFPRGRSLPYVEATVAAASSVGVRIHACRGTLTKGPDPEVVQTVDEVVEHSRRLIERFHDPEAGAAVRVALAPCGAHVDEPELFDALAALAADHEGVRLHTHLYEKVDATACREIYGCTPWEMLSAHGWAQPRTWLAHVVDPPASEIGEMAAAGVSVSHLVAPDLRMGWGPAPLRSFLDAGVTVGFGTTGSASNDGANLLGDLRLAALAHRSSHPDEPGKWPTARELIGMATRGSADCLGRPDLGRIAPGFQADLAAWDLRGVDRVGVRDPVAGLLLTGISARATLVMVGGRLVVDGGQLVGADEASVSARARAALAGTSITGNPISASRRR